MNTLLRDIQGFFLREEGAAAIEYALLGSLIAVVLVAAIVIVGARLDCVFDVVGDCLGGNTACAIDCAGNTPD